MNLEALCADTVKIVTHIGHEIWLQSQHVQTLQVREKAAGDVATEIDLWAETELRHALLALLPDSRFMGEETGGTMCDDPTWIVDPIDGTANFARGYPQWSVSVALALGGKPVLGVIADPNRDEVFFASQGHGAWVKGRAGLTRLTCAQQAQTLKATVATVFPKPHSVWMTPYLVEFERVIRAVGQVRRSGSMALELAYVAAGRADAFWERGMQAWDAAAGWVLLQESGGQIVAMDQLPILSSQFLAAGSPSMLGQLVALLCEPDAIQS